jgi:hypothetical protein
MHVESLAVDDAAFSPIINADYLYNSLQFPRVSERVLDDHIRAAHDILLRRKHLPLLLWEVYPAILRHPATRLRELDHCTFGVEEEEILRVGYR